MLLVFLPALALQLFFWGYLLLDAFPKKEILPVVRTDPPGAVSVIVCFRNEAAVLPACLRGLLAQEYAGEVEILAVDDNSTDASAAIVRELIAAGHPQLKLLQPGPTRPGKKDALTCGIHAASHELLLLTDADCVPASTTWLRLMTAPLADQAEVVLGAGPYSPAGQSLLNRFQRFEANYVALKYLGFARRGRPYMGVGRNLAYRKSFFLRAGGFAAHADLPGGDDDLLVGHHALPARTTVVTTPAARTVSRLSPDWRTFLRQRLRHQSAGFRYRPATALLLGVLALSHGLFYLLGFALLFSGWWWLALLGYVVRFPLVYVAHRRAEFSGADAGASKGTGAMARTAGQVVWADALIAPFYLFLAVGGRREGKGW